MLSYSETRQIRLLDKLRDLKRIPKYILNICLFAIFVVFGSVLSKEFCTKELTGKEWKKVYCSFQNNISFGWWITPDIQINIAAVALMVLILISPSA